VRVFFRREGASWKLVGLDRLPPKLTAGETTTAGRAAP
jgi:hypothetical protein